MKHWKTILKIAAFVLLFSLCFAGVSSLFHTGDNFVPGMLRSFEKAKPGTLDAVYVGSSTVYAFFVSTAAWDNRGYAVQPLSISALPPQSIRLLIEDARKKHPDALYIISLNSFQKTSMSEGAVHYLLDFMPMGETKLKLFACLWNRSDLTGPRQVEYLLPFLRFHSQWQDISVNTLNGTYPDYKGSYAAQQYYNNAKDLSRSYHVLTERTPMTDGQQAILDDLLGYLSENGVNALFVLVPQSVEDDIHTRLNSVADAVEEAGFPVLNLMNEAEALNLDVKTDFYDDAHTNIRGGLSFTRYLCDELGERYGFEDKRGRAGYEDWDEATEAYHTAVGGKVLDHEWALAVRDNTLGTPKLISAQAGEAGITVRWKKAAGAERCQIYRKKNKGAWVRVAEVPGDTAEWTDTEELGKGTYTYTVDAARETADGWVYGQHDIDGVSAQR